MVYRITMRISSARALVHLAMGLNIVLARPLRGTTMAEFQRTFSCNSVEKKLFAIAELRYMYTTRKTGRISILYDAQTQIAKISFYDSGDEPEELKQMFLFVRPYLVATII